MIGNDDRESQQPSQRRYDGRANGVDVENVGAQKRRGEDPQYGVHECFEARRPGRPDSAQTDRTEHASAAWNEGAPDQDLDLATEVREPRIKVLGVCLDPTLDVRETTYAKNEQPHAGVPEP